jgi:predicted AlkP superfamily pyrophosphatase or phosphodiesterase
MATQEQNLILFLIDGLRPDALARAHTPVIDELIAYGASTMAAQTVMPSITLPCIASLILGTPPDVHGITSNTWTNPEPGPGLFELVARSQQRAASFYNWEQLRDLSRPGYLEASLFLKNDGEAEGAGDTALVEKATTYLVGAQNQQMPIHFTFVYLGHTDAAGHTHGWMSAPYLRAIENADACIGHLLATLRGESDRINGTPAYTGATYGVIITADHGGHDTKHGSEDDADMTIPLIIYGHPDFAPGQEIPGPVSILDIAPTLAAWMGLTPPSGWTGRILAPEPLSEKLA